MKQVSKGSFTQRGKPGVVPYPYMDETFSEPTDITQHQLIQSPKSYQLCSNLIIDMVFSLKSFCEKSGYICLTCTLEIINPLHILHVLNELIPKNHDSTFTLRDISLELFCQYQDSNLQPANCLAITSLTVICIDHIAPSGSQCYGGSLELPLK